MAADDATSSAPPPEPIDWRVHAGLIAVQAIFAGFHVVAKAVLAQMEPLALVGLRVALATPILVFFAYRHDRYVPRMADLPWLAALGLTGVFLNQILFISGLERTTATNAAILMPSIPVFAAGVAALFGVERLRARRLAGIFLAAAGALVMVGPAGFSMGAGAAIGNALILANCLSYAGFLVLQRPVLRRIPWRTTIAGAFAFGSLGVIAVASPALGRLEPAALPPGVWWGLAYIVLFPTALSYALNTWAVGKSSPSLAAAYTTLQPLLTASLAALFLGESAGWAEAAGFVLIVGGLVLVSRPGRRQDGRSEVGHSSDQSSSRTPRHGSR